MPVWKYRDVSEMPPPPRPRDDDELVRRIRALWRRSRRFGIRPTVRGTAMNAVDHPHGGGRGRSKGNNQPRSPWNQPAKGFKTRSRHQTDRFILRDRRSKTKGVNL